MLTNLQKTCICKSENSPLYKSWLIKKQRKRERERESEREQLGEKARERESNFYTR